MTGPRTRSQLPLASARSRWLDAELATRSGVSDRDRRRRLLVAGATLVLGAAALSWSLRLSAGDPRFIPATLALAAVWTIGSLACGPPLRRAGRRLARRAAPELGVGLAAGAVLLGVFLLGSGAVAQAPPLRDPVHALLAHAHWGSLGPVLAVAVLNGVVEEAFFRGALHDALPARWAPVATTVAYTLATAAAGIVLLAFAALLLGALCAALRRATGALLAPIACHLIWSTGMILFLEPALEWWA